MSAARKCDRCGTMYEPKGVGTYFKVSCVNKFGDVIGEVKASGDLCGECSTELMAWFHGPRNERKDAE